MLTLLLVSKFILLLFANKRQGIVCAKVFGCNISPVVDLAPQPSSSRVQNIALQNLITIVQPDSPRYIQKNVYKSKNTKRGTGIIELL